MYPKSRYFGLKVVPIVYFGAKVSTIWVHGPLGILSPEQSPVWGFEFVQSVGLVQCGYGTLVIQMKP